MTRRLVFILTLFLFMFYSIHVKFNLVEVKASNDYPVHNLNTGLNYTTIQEAINANETLNGNTIFVESGMYHEHVVVNKSLSIIGENKEETIVDGNGTGTVFFINSRNTTLRGFTAKNASDGIIVSSIIYPYARNVTIDDNIISDNTNYGIGVIGIYLPPPSSFDKPIIKNNIVKNNKVGVFLGGQFNNTIYQNEVKNNSECGIQLTGSIYQPPEIFGSHLNLIVGNKLTENGVGLDLLGKDNKFYHNNFVDNLNQVQVQDHRYYNNSWSCDHPGEGNYWSNYNGTDSNHDGIGDTPHVLDEDNIDNYPLMGMFSDCNVTWWPSAFERETHHVNIISNSTISDFGFEAVLVIGELGFRKKIYFNITGAEGAVGFCRIRIPAALMNDTYKVFVNSTEVPHTLLPCSNSTHSYLYFTYSHSTQEVVIVPEFPLFIILPLFMTITSLTVMMYRRKHT